MKRDLRAPALTILLLAGLAGSLRANEAPIGAGPAVKGTYRVPYRLTETRHLLVRAKLNGKGPFRFVIDTGAPALYVSTEAAKKAGVAPDAEGWGAIDRMEIEGGPVLEKVSGRIEEPFQLKGMNALGLAGTRMDGVFGYTVLARFRMEIDLTRPVMTWSLLDYEPPLPAPLAEPAGKPVEPPPGIAGLENLAKIASTLLPQRGEDEVVGRGFLGIELEAGAGVPRVRAALPASPAAGAGLLPGDRLTHLTLPGGQPQALRSAAHLLGLTAKAKPGDALLFSVQRAAKTLKITVKAGKGL